MLHHPTAALRREPPSSADIDQALIDALADLWADCYRRDQLLDERLRMFEDRLGGAVKCATGLERVSS